MEIEIEVGTDEQKELIHNELESVLGITKKFPEISDFKKIIVSADFEKTVNQISNRNDFNMYRGIDTTAFQVAAKILGIKEEPILVINPIMYTSDWDNHVRTFVFFHEMMHLIHSDQKHEYSEDTRSRREYYNIIYELYDEYYCDRFAYSAVNSLYDPLSDLYINRLRENFENYNNIFKDGIYEKQIRETIELKNDDELNVDEFWTEWNKVFGVIPYSIMHYFPIVQEYEEFESQVITNLPPFINSRTIGLLKYFEEKYEQKSFDLSDGLEHIDSFMRNLAIRFHDIEDDEIFIEFVALYDFY